MLVGLGRRIETEGGLRHPRERGFSLENPPKVSVTEYILEGIGIKK